MMGPSMDTFNKSMAELGTWAGGIAARLDKVSKLADEREAIG